MALQIKIASPCSEKWESMAGDERRRFCAKCALHVHDLKELSEAEVEELLRGVTGRVCGRVFQRADGTVLTKDCPVGVATLRRRAVMSMVGVLAVFVALAGLATGARTADDGGATPLGTGLKERTIAAKEWLRGTALFGPIINRFDPAPPPVMLGELIAVPPSPRTP